MNPGQAFYHGEGCAESNGSGYKGPMSLYEM
jgi:type II secretory ATPase GspE/PulE/Tfp pilus assembly ATPase PilB-like protein